MHTWWPILNNNPPLPHPPVIFMIKTRTPLIFGSFNDLNVSSYKKNNSNFHNVDNWGSIVHFQILTIIEVLKFEHRQRGLNESF